MSPANRTRYRSCSPRAWLGAALFLLAGGAIPDAAAAGLICVSNDTLQFGNHPVGSNTTADVIVTNCGDAAWSFTEVSLDPASGPAFQVGTTCSTGLTLAPGATCTVNVLFAPKTTGQSSGGLWLYNSTDTAAELITFYGRGTNGENGSAVLAFVPASADFGSQMVGTQAGPVTIALHNLGPAALTPSAIVLNGPQVYDFFGFDGSCVIGTPIAPGDSCNMSLFFRPEATGVRLADLVIDAPQLASLAIMSISGTGQPPSSSGPAHNYGGLWWAAPAGSESGWGINFAHQGSVIFATWLTYELNGKAWWLSMTAPEVAGGQYSGELYVTTGPAFNAQPFDPAQVSSTSVGSGTLSFSDANDGTFAYTVNGIAQTKHITRQIFGPLPVCATATASLASATNFQDLWWASPAGSESGWGINLTHQGETIFATWFTYDLDHSLMWLAATAVKTATGVYSGSLYRATGPAFNAVPFNPAQVAQQAVGTATFTFSDGNSGSFAYVVNATAQTKSITREIFQAPGTVCQ